LAKDFIIKEDKAQAKPLVLNPIDSKSECSLNNLLLFGFNSRATQFPNQAIVSMSAVELRIRAGTTRVKALFTVAVFVFITRHYSFSIGMKAAFLGDTLQQ